MPPSQWHQDIAYLNLLDAKLVLMNVLYVQATSKINDDGLDIRLISEFANVR